MTHSLRSIVRVTTKCPNCKCLHQSAPTFNRGKLVAPVCGRSS